MMRRFVMGGLKLRHLKGPLYLRRMTGNSLSRKYSAQKAKCHFNVVKRFAESFTYNELFPDVQWNKIAPGKRQLYAQYLIAETYYAIGQEYIKTNSPAIYAETAFRLAYEQLDNCRKIDPDNQIRQILQKCEFDKNPHRTPETIPCT